MSDTLETDAAEHDIDEIPEFPFVSSNFARKLERERNNLRKESYRFICLWDKATKELESLKFGPETDAVVTMLRQNESPVEIPVLIGHAMRMEAERDEWKAECKRQWVYLSHARHNACEIQNIQWGHDGDCGADRLANLIEEDCHRGMMSLETAKCPSTP